MHSKLGSDLGPRACLLVGLTFTFAAGCGPSFGEVSGKVTYNGKSVPAGVVAFLSAESNEPATAQLERDGSYRLPKVRCGPARITVTAPDPKFARKPPVLGPHAKEKDKLFHQRELEAFVEAVQLPQRYADAEKSRLAHTVQSGTQTFDIPLVKD